MTTTESRTLQDKRIATTDAGFFHLGNNDQPRVSIVTAPFTGVNYLTWSTSIQISLGAKDKLGFIDGSIKRPDESSADFPKWQSLGSQSKDLAESFIYCSTQIFWEELKECFNERNGPQVYELQREISSIQQGNNTLTTYYNKLKKLWEDLNNLRSLPSCTCEGWKCGVMKTLTETESLSKTIQFLMGLNENFDPARNQILMQDPLPNLKKVFAMLLNVES